MKGRGVSLARTVRRLPAELRQATLIEGPHSFGLLPEQIVDQALLAGLECLLVRNESSRQSSVRGSSGMVPVTFTHYGTHYGAD
jgi:hypothetical protein